MAQGAAQGDPPHGGHRPRRATGRERTLPDTRQLRETPERGQYLPRRRQQLSSRTRTVREVTRSEQRRRVRRRFDLITGS